MVPSTLPRILLQFHFDDPNDPCEYGSCLKTYEGNMEHIPLVGDRIIYDGHSGVVHRRYFYYNKNGMENVTLQIGGPKASLPYQCGSVHDMAEALSHSLRMHAGSAIKV